MMIRAEIEILLDEYGKSESQIHDSADIPSVVLEAALVTSLAEYSQVKDFYQHRPSFCTSITITAMYVSVLQGNVLYGLKIRGAMIMAAVFVPALTIAWRIDGRYGKKCETQVRKTTARKEIAAQWLSTITDKSLLPALLIPCGMHEVDGRFEDREIVDSVEVPLLAMLKDLSPEEYNELSKEAKNKIVELLNSVTAFRNRDICLELIRIVSNSIDNEVLKRMESLGSEDNLIAIDEGVKTAARNALKDCGINR